MSDSGLGKKEWDEIREIQQKLGEAGPRAAWVTTDDLNADYDHGVVTIRKGGRKEVLDFTR